MNALIKLKKLFCELCHKGTLKFILKSIKVQFDSIHLLDGCSRIISYVARSRDLFVYEMFDIPNDMLSDLK